MKRLPDVLLPWAWLLLAGCSSAGLYPSLPLQASLPDGPDVAVTHAPYEAVHANWKERLSRPYVFVEHQGDYREVGAAMRRLLSQCADEDVAATGPPFVLFFDDPGAKPPAELVSRACLPVDPDARIPDGMRRDVLPAAMVAYARVAGAYPEVPRAYPGLFGYLRERGWTARGPVREVYLVDPGDVASYDELLTEVQVPWVVDR